NLTISILIEFVQLSVDDSLTHHKYVWNFDRSFLLLYVLGNVLLKGLKMFGISWFLDLYSYERGRGPLLNF
ncbi:hypothetical protein ACO1LX_14830, partial [Staphylococcus aureus]